MRGIIGFLILVSCASCSLFSDRSDAVDGPPEITAPDGFRTEVLYHPMAEDSSSWVSLTLDGEGRLLASDQYGVLYRITPPPIGGDPAETQVEKLDIHIGHAQGLLWAFNSLYVMVNSEEGVEGRSSGLYRVTDSDGDAELDTIYALAKFEGFGEHGPHGIVLGPDAASLYLVCGNHTDLPEDFEAIVPPVWQEDQLIEVLRDPRGHAQDRKAPGGWIMRTDSVGSKWELISVGFRNAYDLAFTPEGELFTFDSDMEWDLGMPWYRPIRLIHVTSGSEYGWRTGSGKWPEYYPDALPAVTDIGQGSPTGVLSTANAAFPLKYRQGLLLFDWSFGTIYYVSLESRGSTYTGRMEEFLSGAPLPVTDGVIGADGAFYFATGGRRLNSFLWRVYYEGTGTHAPDITTVIPPQMALRRALEAHHGAPADPAVIAAVWPHLGHPDRNVRFAARIAIEHQPVASWQDLALNESNPASRIQAIVALARHGDSSRADAAMQSLMAIDVASLSREQELELMRAAGLVLIRLGSPEDVTREALITRLDAHYPSGDAALNRERGRLLAALEAPGIVDKMLMHLSTLSEVGPAVGLLLSEDVAERSEQYGGAITELRANPPGVEEIDLVMSLRNVQTGWTLDARTKFFTWFYGALRRSGGHSYAGFLEDMRADAIAHLNDDERQSLGGLVESSAGPSLADLPQPEGPGRKWNGGEIREYMQDAMKEPRDLERGRTMYAAALCETCHRMGETGGSIGPDLTAIGTRFSRHEIVTALDLPSDEISDQYAAQIITRTDGSTIVGRIIEEDDESIVLSQNPYDPSRTISIPKSDEAGRENSPVSTMPSRLLDRLSGEEVADLMAFLISGGDAEHKCYTGEEGCNTRDADE